MARDNQYLFGVDRSRNIAIGNQFGDLTVTRRTGRDKHRAALWTCKCKCGSEVVKSTGVLKSGRVKSCGCLYARTRGRTHGLSRSPIHKIWMAMMSRCYDQANARYHRYGGRGINVCRRWHDVSAFLEDMGDPPKTSKVRGSQIERNDNDKGYSPENCRWATPKEQSRNRSNTIFVEFRGETKPLAEWIEELGLPYPPIRRRIIDRGWTVEEAFTIPLRVTKAAPVA
jgi:hypothetical protein